MSRANLAYKTEPVTAEEYLAFERAAKDKHEFIGGKIVAMAGATDRHNVIASNVFLEIGIQLKATKCRAFASDMRVNAKQGNYFYPDIVVTCGERKFEDIKKKMFLLIRRSFLKFCRNLPNSKTATKNLNLLFCSKA